MHEQPNAPRNPGDIDARLHPDGLPAPHAPHDPNRIENALHPDGPPAPHPRDPREDFRLDPERPRDPREEFMLDRPGDRPSVDQRLHPDGPPAPHAPRDPNRIENALHPDGPPAPHAPRDPNRIENALHPDGPPAPHAPRDPNRIENALHPDGPPAPHDPNRIDNTLNPERPAPPRDPREDFMQRPEERLRDPREDFMREDGPRDPREDFRQDPPGQHGDQPSASDGYGSSDQQAPGDSDPFAQDRFEAGPPQSDEFVEAPDSPEHAETYRQARTATHDVPRVAELTGVDPDMVALVKEHLFVRTHDVAVGPGDLRHGNFTPLGHVAGLWQKVLDGKSLTPNEVNELRSLVAHEYVEAKLMESGVPYDSAHPSAWDEDGGRLATRGAARAHLVSPRPLQSWAEADLLRHWGSFLDLTPPPGGIAADLSNLDDVVRAAKEGMGW
jgi:hypothetical protein